ncbi:unnamed protein product [Moneuplotes crassus]|uniref:V-SNARE coiled-coil homology domain-containing protein n=1 Tax=Euplotes crassus TaxID=5936 RepID=A0AAD1XTZ1_EUPCR|nr:unnamed protein product [Moneuplotes crassus]
MSVYHIIIAKIVTNPKLGSPFVVFDLCCDESKVPQKLQKDLKNQSGMKRDVKEFLSDADPDSFIQKDFVAEGLLKTVFIKPNKQNMNLDDPDYVLYFGCITDLAINESKVGRFLKDMSRVVVDNYVTEEFSKNTDISAEFANVCWQTIDNHNLAPYNSVTGEGGPVVDFTRVRLGNKKLKNLKETLLTSVNIMASNVESAEKLHSGAEDLKQGAYKFKKQAKEAETIAKRRSHWWCSKQVVYWGGFIVILTLLGVIWFML